KSSPQILHLMIFIHVLLTSALKFPTMPALNRAIAASAAARSAGVAPEPSRSPGPAPRRSIPAASRRPRTRQVGRRDLDAQAAAACPSVQRTDASGQSHRDAIDALFVFLNSRRKDSRRRALYWRPSTHDRGRSNTLFAVRM